MWRFLGWCLILLFLAVVTAGAAGGWILWTYGQGLADHRQLVDYQPKTMTRVHAADGRLVAEFARERRVFVPAESMPLRLKQAFLAAEDQHFYQHPGLDVQGLARAVVTNLKNLGKGRRLVGASTITQQVAKNFLLTNEVSFTRKFKEAILAFRIENAMSKDRILELYLNEIFLGYHSYGVAAAAMNYFNRSLDELALEEIAYLASLPKAPNNYHPVRKYDAAIIRRNWVLGRMVEEGHITAAEAAAAQERPLVVRKRTDNSIAGADYYAEEVRRQLIDRFGEAKVYEAGLSVRTTLDGRLQEIAERELRNGLIAYDRRHGWRGPLMRGLSMTDPVAALEKVPMPKGALDSWHKAVVIQSGVKTALFMLEDGLTARMDYKEMRWAREPREKQKVGPAPKQVDSVLKPGDVVMVELLPEDPERKKNAKDATDALPRVTLRQVPKIEGALVAIDPHTGRVQALVGGFNFGSSQFNRATQANRQTGSAFKPFVYAAALDSGFTPSSLVLDAPFVIDQGAGQGKWRPSNYSNKFYGPSTLRLGIEKSRNLMTVRLAQYIGMDKVAEYGRRFGLFEDLPPLLSYSLGSGETTLMKITAGYAMFVNGGKKITPSVLDRVQDRRGNIIWQHDGRPCDDCGNIAWNGQDEPLLPDMREEVIPPHTAYQMTSILEGVVKRGTGRRIAALGKPLGGKTGTTNESKDTWFVGFAPDLAVGVFAGFDEPKGLGRGETGSSVAVPIFRDFMKHALADRQAIPFRVPDGIRLVKVRSSDGTLARPGDKGVILEAFVPGSEPTSQSKVLDAGFQNLGTVSSGELPQTGTGGLY